MNTKTEAERQLVELISMPTISDDIPANDMALDYIQAYLAERGMFCHRDRFDGHGTLVASTRKDNSKNPVVYLAAHVDVMSGGEELFALKQKGDQLLGRGVYDMKFAIAGYMQLTDDLRGSLSEYDFAIMITTDEEYGGAQGINGTNQLLKAGYRSKVAIVPDSAASGWDVEALAKSHWRFELMAKGRTAHSSRPWEGESASFKLIQALHELKQHFNEHGPKTDTLNIGLIHGDGAYNKIPSRMTAAVEIRLASKASFKKTKGIIDKIRRDHELAYKEDVLYMPHRADVTHPLVQSYMDSVQAVAGRRPEPVTSFAFSDAYYFGLRDIPTIVSCCLGGKHHSDDEWISRESFLQFVPILRDYVEKITRKSAKVFDSHDKMV